MDSGLTAVNDYTGNEWKLTLLDETREFAVTEQTVSGKPGDTITLNYTGATTGTNEYISVIIADENGAQYYGRVAQPGGESGTATLSIPADLAPGSYTLNVFSEQYNGDYKTDYASAFAEVALTVEEAAAPGIDTGKAIQLVDSGTPQISAADRQTTFILVHTSRAVTETAATTSTRSSGGCWKMQVAAVPAFRSKS